MVNFINGWSQVSSSTLQSMPQMKSSSIGGSVIDSALGAIKMVAGNSAQQTNAALALLMLCAAGGVGLIWLFKKCCGSNHVKTHSTPVLQPVPVYTPPTNHWGWIPKFSSFPKLFIPAKPHGNPHFVPAAKPHPSVFVPANPHPTNFVPANPHPTNFIPANPHPATFLPANPHPTNFVPANSHPATFVPASHYGAGAPQPGFIPASSAASPPKHFVPAAKHGFIPAK